MSKCQICGIFSSNVQSKLENLMFHRFPIRDFDVCRKWVEFCNKDELRELHITNKRLLNERHICSRHFQRGQYMSATSNRLMPYEVPGIAPPPNQLPQLVLDKKKNEETTPTEEMYDCNTSSGMQPSCSYSVESFVEPMEVTVDSLPEPLATSSPHAVKGRLVKKTLSKRKPILHSIQARRVAELTPRKRILYKSLTKERKTVQQFRVKCKKLTSKLKSVGTEQDSVLATSMTKRFSPVVASLFKSQLVNSVKKPKGRRWTNDDKVLGMAILKRSPTCHQMMRNILVLPSRSTITRSLNSIPFFPGINESIFMHLMERVQTFSEDQLFCSLVFDEVSLSEGLQYSESLDQVEGFEDYGHLGRTGKIANHALVFLIQGLLVKWKQPVAYYFCRDTTPTDKLKVLIKEVISALQSIGLCIVATVCDLGSTNLAAIKALIADTRTDRPGPFFEVNGEQIVTIFDPPHLLKCTRNALRKYNCIFESKKVAKWSYLEDFYYLDNLGDCRSCVRLKKAHIFPDGFRAMRVNLAAQVMSESVAGVISAISMSDDIYKSLKSKNSDHLVLPKEAKDLSDFLLLVDRLFDSFNGSSLYPDGGKTLRCCLSKNSAHHNFWSSAIGNISSWKFVTSSGKTQKNRFQTAWVDNIRAVQILWKRLSGLGVERLCLRNLNQDSVENLFCIIRQQGLMNTNPTTWQFVPALKASIVNNFVTSSSKNCQNDGNDFLSDLKSFMELDCKVNTRNIRSLIDSLCVVPEIEKGSNSEASHSEPIATQERPCRYLRVVFTLHELTKASYTAGYISRKLNTKCPLCTSSIIHPHSKPPLPEHLLISAKERSKDVKRLTYPTKLMVTKFCMVNSVLLPKIKRIVGQAGILLIVVTDILKTVDLFGIGCADHCRRLHVEMVVLMCRMWIHTNCRRDTTSLREGNMRVQGTAQPARFESSAKRIRKVRHC